MLRYQQQHKESAGLFRCFDGHLSATTGLLKFENSFRFDTGTGSPSFFYCLDRICATIDATVHKWEATRVQHDTDMQLCQCNTRTKLSYIGVRRFIDVETGRRFLRVNFRQLKT